MTGNSPGLLFTLSGGARIYVRSDAITAIEECKAETWADGTKHPALTVLHFSGQMAIVLEPFDEVCATLGGVPKPEPEPEPEPLNSDVALPQATYDHLVDLTENPPEPSARLHALLHVGAGGCGCPQCGLPTPPEPEALERYGRGYSSGVGPLLWGKIKIPLVLENMLFVGVIQRGLSVVGGASPLPAGLAARLGELGIQVQPLCGDGGRGRGVDVGLAFDTSCEEVERLREVLKPGGWLVGSVREADYLQLPERLERKAGCWTGLQSHLDDGFEYFSMRKR